MSRDRDPRVAATQGRLTTFLREDPEECFFQHLVTAIHDPLRPLTGNGRLRINPLLLILAAITLFAVCVFLFFSVGQP